MVSSLPDGIKVDRKSRLILKGLASEGGEANTTQLRELYRTLSRQDITHRVGSHLEPAELVTSHQPENESRGRHPPKEYTLTERGEDYLNSIEGGVLDGEIAERLDGVENELDALRKENRELRRENEELKETIRDSGVDTVVSKVPELTSDVDDLQVTVGNLQDALGDIQTHPVIENQEVAVGLNDIIVMANACRRVIESEVEDGETLVERESEEVREIAGERGLLFDED